uniref:Putative secreted protein n=1 Tax=Amblyomma triste TaxID=251400 RepID=A0A023G1Z8_AMBTT
MIVTLCLLLYSRDALSSCQNTVAGEGLYVPVLIFESPANCDDVLKSSHQASVLMLSSLHLQSTTSSYPPTTDLLLIFPVFIISYDSHSFLACHMTGTLNTFRSFVHEDAF